MRLVPDDLRKRRVNRVCDYCGSRIVRGEIVSTLYGDHVKHQEIFRGIVYHPDCVRSELNKLLASIPV